MRTGPTLLFVSLISLLPGAASAQSASPPPYSPPWQLRGAAVATSLRSDTAIAFYEPDGAGQGGTTIVSILNGSYKVTPELGAFLRLGVVSSSPPGGPSAAGFLNPIFGGTWGRPLGGHLKLAATLAVALPLASGGGNEPNEGTRAAMGAGALARSAMDNALFGVNYLTVFGGVDLALVMAGFTAQVEATLFEAGRMRGDDVDADETRTNLTMGLHVGYFVLPILSVGADLRLQRWLVSETFLGDGRGANDENVSVALGPRLHLELAEGSWVRPGIAWARGLDDPLGANGYDTIQIDVPVTF